MAKKTLKTPEGAQIGLSGKILIAMPDLKDDRFTKTLVYLMEHNEKGAMGIVINKRLGEVSLSDLIKQVNLSLDVKDTTVPVYFGGPVEHERGFILHSTDILYKQSKHVPNGPYALTATTDVIHSIALNKGPEKMIFALGYAGWGPGQLDNELRHNAWLHVDPDETIVFCGEQEKAWTLALKKLGVSVEALQSGFGTA